MIEYYDWEKTGLLDDLSAVGAIKMKDLLQNQYDCMKKAETYERGYTDEIRHMAESFALPMTRRVFGDVVENRKFQVVVSPVFKVDGVKRFIHTYKLRTIIQRPLDGTFFDGFSGLSGLDREFEFADVVGPKLKAEIESIVDSNKSVWWYTPFCAMLPVTLEEENIQRYGFMSRYRRDNG